MPSGETIYIIGGDQRNESLSSLFAAAGYPTCTFALRASRPDWPDLGNARWIVGPHQRRIFAYSILLAPILLLASDILGRLVMHPSEIPVGVVTAFVGAPVLIALVRRKTASGL